LSDRIGRKPVLLTITCLAFLTAYPALSWLVSAPTFGKMLAVEMLFSFYFGIYSGTMLAALVEVVPRPFACANDLLLACLCAGCGPARHIHAIRLDLADRAYRQPRLPRLLADGGRRQRRHCCTCDLSQSRRGDCAKADSCMRHAEVNALQH